MTIKTQSPWTATSSAVDFRQQPANDRFGSQANLVRFTWKLSSACPPPAPRYVIISGTTFIYPLRAAGLRVGMNDVVANPRPRFPSTSPAFSANSSKLPSPWRNDAMAYYGAMRFMQYVTAALEELDAPQPRFRANRPSQADPGFVRPSPHASHHTRQSNGPSSPHAQSTPQPTRRATPPFGGAPHPDAAPKPRARPEYTAPPQPSAPPPADEAPPPPHSTAREDHLKVLGLSTEATFEDVRKAYRRLALELHPDKNSHLSEEEKAAKTERFKQVANAYQALEEAQQKS